MIDPSLVGFIRGRIEHFDGTPVIGASVSVADYPGYGQTVTSSCGDFYFAVNGGQSYTVVVHQDGLVDGHRVADVPMGDFTWIDDLIMRPIDPTKTVVQLGGSAQTTIVAQGSQMTDADGPRRATLMIPASTNVTVRNADGSVAKNSLNSITVSVSEFTVGPNGPLAMPARLPPISKYTYAAAFKIDEADDTQTVEFSQTLHAYVDNFLKFPVGTLVPSGYYDQVNHYWKASDDGIVVQILNITSGQAVIGINPNGSPATSDQLSQLGILPSELASLASTFSVGQQFWRVPISHFTIFDFNWCGGAPTTEVFLPDSRNRGFPQPALKGNKRCDQCSHSTINIPTHTLNETLPITGTPFVLNYQSDWMPGYLKNYELDIPVGSLHSDSNGIDTNVHRVDVQVEVEGARYKTTINGSPNERDNYAFMWNGRDQFGRKVYGGSAAKVTVTQYLDNPPYLAADGSQVLSTTPSWAETTGVVSNVSRTASLIPNTIKWTGLVGAASFVDPSRSKMGGWSLNIQHFKDQINNIIYFGDGSVRRGYATNLVMTKLYGNTSEYSRYSLPTDYKYPLTIAKLTGSRITVGPDDSIYTMVTQGSGSNLLAKLGPTGSQAIIAGNGQLGQIGADNVDPLLTTIGNCSASSPFIRVADNGAVYFMECGYLNQLEYLVVRRIDPITGLVSTVAGRNAVNGETAATVSLQNGDGGPAIDSLLPGPLRGMALDSAGNIYISTATTIRKITTSGMITTVAGLGPQIAQADKFSPDNSGNEGPALNATMQPAGIAVAADGSLYIADQFTNQIRRIATDGRIDAAAGEYPGTGTCVFASTDPLPANEVCLSNVGDLVIGRDGTVYFSTFASLMSLTPQGSVLVNVGRDGSDYNGSIKDIGSSPNFASAGHVTLFGHQFAIDAKGNFLWNDSQKNIWRSQPVLGDLSSDGTEIYLFDQNGQHQKTIDTLTGATRYALVYNNNLLTSITDINGLITTLERDSRGNISAIVAPYGARTELSVDSSGYLAMLTNPLQQKAKMSYNSDAVGGESGLLASFQDFNGRTSHYVYDDLGLITTSTDPIGAVSTIATVTERDSTLYDPQERISNYISALGRVTTYDFRNSGDTDAGTVISYPDRTGAQVNSSQDSNSDSDYVWQTSESLSDDPRFGAYARYNSVETLYSGDYNLFMKVSRTKGATVSDATDPFSATKLVETVFVNSDQIPYVNTTDVVNRIITSKTPQGYVSTVSYDPKGKVIKALNPAVAPVSMSYDSDGRLSRLAQGENCDQAASAGCRVYSYSYLPLGQPGAGEVASITDPLGRIINFQYDGLGRTISSTFGGLTTSLAYDGLDNLTAVIPPGATQSTEHSFSYNAVGLLQSYTPPSVQPPSNTTTTFGYDLDRSLTNLSFPNATSQAVVTYSYDPTSGHLRTSTQPDGVVTYGYDSIRYYLNSMTGPGNVGFNVVKSGDLITSEQFVNVPAMGASPTVSRTYNDRLQLSKLQIDQGTAYNYSYDADGFLNGVNNMMITRGANGSNSGLAFGTFNTVLSYDIFGDLISSSTSNSGTDLYSSLLTKDVLGRTTGRTESINASPVFSSFQFDSLNRLSSATISGSTVSYSYDSNGNRLNNGAAYDAQDRLISDNVFTYTYDGRGALRQKVSKLDATVSSYTYDVFGHLKAASLPGGKSVNYQLDGLGRRVARQANGGAWTGFIYQGSTQVIATVDATGAMTEQFVYGTSGSSPDYMVKGAATYRFISDERGSIRLVVNISDGTIAQRLDYDVWGNVVADTNPGFQPFGFAGGFYDSVTGFTHFGARDLDSSTGRWTSKDPLLFDGGQSNFYVYVANDPVNWIDASGLATVPLDPKAASLLAALKFSIKNSGDHFLIAALADIEGKNNATLFTSNSDNRFGNRSSCEVIGATYGNQSSQSIALRSSVTRDTNSIFNQGVLFHELVHTWQKAGGAYSNSSRDRELQAQAYERAFNSSFGQ